MNVKNSGTLNDYEKTEELEECSHLLNEWEQDYIQSLQEQMSSGRCGKCLTDNQKDKLNIIYERAVINNESYNLVTRD